MKGEGQGICLVAIETAHCWIACVAKAIFGFPHLTRICYTYRACENDFGSFPGFWRETNLDQAIVKYQKPMFNYQIFSIIYIMRIICCLSKLDEAVCFSG